MSALHTPSFDLNLLPVLEALLRLQSVTRAGEITGRTQSATSHALARLRETFGDELLVRSGRGFLRTPRAEALLPEVTAALASAHALLRPATAFAPATSTRRFVIACPDLLAAIVPSLVATLAREAPRVRLAFEPLGSGVGERLASGGLDVALGAREDGPSLVKRPLGEVTFGVVARRAHPAIPRGKSLDLATWLAHPHVVVGTGSGTPSFVKRALDREKLARVVGVEVPTFVMALYLAAETDHFFTAPRELVAALVALLDLRVHAVPVPVAPVEATLVWHERARADDGHAWLRKRLEAHLGALLAKGRDATRR